MFLDCKILELTQSVSYGSVTLKSLQNDNIPEIDLLVREAIQNSSDASLKEDADSFMVQFNTGTFCPARLNDNLTGIETLLDDMFPMEIADFLEIRDTKTRGLTGPIRMKDITTNDHGNFFKLIFDTGKKQTQAGAGGNWGFGKSVYYRIGMGIVIFYSRIKADVGYESRLIITLVENEESPGAILSKVKSRSAGKAWWGLIDGEDVLPLTDEHLIQEILDVFHLTSFGPTETGTSIIIPYIDKKGLVQGIIPAEANLSDDVRERCTWADNFEEYLNLSIQKWYAPKIQNRNLKNFCDKKWLRVYINGNPMRFDSMLPFFRVVQELYTTAIAKAHGAEYKSEWLKNNLPTCLPVSINSYFGDAGSTAGYVAVIRITKAEMYGSQSYLDPCIYTRHFEEDPDINEPMVMYARDPGMVIEYPIAGPWVKNIAPPDNSEEYILGFFVPITSKRLKEDLSEKKYAGMNLGEYLRECEASDHMGWNDPANMQVVARIQKNTVNQICRKMIPTPAAQIEATASKLSSRLGRKLLPEIGYGRTRSRDRGDGANVGGARASNIIFKPLVKKFQGNELILEYELSLLQAKRNAEISLLINSEAGLIDQRSWNEDVGTQFPIRISSFEIKEILKKKDSVKLFDGFIANDKEHQVANEFVEIALVHEMHTCSHVKIQITEPSVEAPVLRGEIRLCCNDKKYKPSFKVN